VIVKSNCSNLNRRNALLLMSMQTHLPWQARVSIRSHQKDSPCGLTEFAGDVCPGMFFFRVFEHLFGVAELHQVARTAALRRVHV
jgi:hypothetical protein